MNTTSTEERVYDAYTRISGMPISTGRTHLLMTFLPGKDTQEAYQAALDFIAIDDKGEPRRDHHFLTFAGDTGCGKTHLALGIGWQWLGLKLGVVKYWHVSELLDAMRDEYDNPPKDDFDVVKPGVFEYCKRASLLILDDLGVEKTSDWVADKLDTLINHRYIEEKPTVLTTNSESQNVLPRLRSRLKEGVVISIDAPDYREVVAKKRKESKDD